MKIKKTVFALLMFVLTVLSSFSAAAVKINDKDFKKDDIIVYSLILKEQPKPFAAFNLKITYDPSTLEIAKSSNSKNIIISPATDNAAIYSTKTPGLISCNAANGINGFENTEDTAILKVYFKVIGNKDSNINYEILELFDLDIVNIDFNDVYSKTENISDTVEDEDKILTSSESGNSSNFVLPDENNTSNENNSLNESSKDNSNVDGNSKDLSEISSEANSSAAKQGEGEAASNLIIKSSDSVKISYVMVAVICIVVLIVILGVIFVILFIKKKNNKVK